MANVYPILEQTTGVYRATITDEGGAMLPASTLSTLELTLYVKTSAGETIINSRNAQNVLNANGVAAYDTLQTDTLSDGTTVTYNLKWIISANDTTLNNSNLK